MKDGALWCATCTKSRKVKQIAGNPRTEFCFCDPKWQQVRLAGRTAIITDKNKKALFFKKHPDAKDHFESPEDPAFTLLEFKPTTVSVMGTGAMDYTDVRW